MEIIPSKKELGVSQIVAYPLDVVQRLGKYQFIYDYRVPSIWEGLQYVPSLLKENEKFNFDGDGTGGITSNKFSKGDVVNVIRFEGTNPVVENPNYKEPAPDAPKSFFSSLLQNLKGFIVPKEYLQKVDDNTPMTMQLGSNFGSNPKPQPIGVKPIIKDLPQPSSDVILEENATFVLNKDFQYISGYGSSYCSPDRICTMDMSPKYSVLKAGTKVTGRLFKSITNEKVLKTIADVRDSMIRPTVIEQNFLAVKGYGNTGSINIPIEYLTRDVATATTTTNNNSGNVVPVTNDNKNLLMIVGAFLVGYVLFSKEKASS